RESKARCAPCEGQGTVRGPGQQGTRSASSANRNRFLVSCVGVERLLLAIDQGTTGSTALVMSQSGATLARANVEFPQHFPSPGWVEHEPEEIWDSVLRAIAEALRQASVRGPELAAIGITNQRETTLLWERQTDRPIHRALVWQD